MLNSWQSPQMQAAVARAQASSSTRRAAGRYGAPPAQRGPAQPGRMPPPPMGGGTDRRPPPPGAQPPVPPRGTGYSPSDRVMQAEAESATILDRASEAVRDGAMRAVEVARSKFAQYTGGASAAGVVDRLRNLITSATADGRLDGREVAQLLYTGYEFTAGVAAYAVDEVQSLFGKIEEVKTRLDAVENATKEQATIADGVDAVNEHLNSIGLIDQGDFMGNLKYGKLWINGWPIDIKAILASLALMKASNIVEEVTTDTTFMDRLSSDAEPHQFTTFVTRVGNDGGGNVLTKFDKKTMTHVLVSKSATDSTKVLKPVLEAFPTAVDGTAFPAGADGVDVYRLSRMRISQDSQSWLQVGATLGVQQIKNGLAQVLPFAGNSIAGLLKINTGTDLSTRGAQR